jgi:hypothetical protein
MLRNKFTVSRINADIDCAIHSYSRDCATEAAAAYATEAAAAYATEAAAAYANAKKDFIKLHERAFRSRGTWAQRSAFSAEFHRMLESMRSMHRELVMTAERNRTEIIETDARFDSSFAEFEEAMRKGVDYDYQKFKALFREYAAWNACDPLLRPFDIDEVKHAISQYTSRVKTVTPVWIAPHSFDLFASVGGADGWKLRTHAAFQSMINARIPNATIACKGSTTELRLWDSGYVFYGDAGATRLPTKAPICRLEFDVSRERFKLDVESATLFFRKVPGYLNPAQSYPGLVDWAAFHHAFLTQIMVSDEALAREIHNCGVLLRLISKTPMADISPRRLRTLMSVFHLVAVDA